MVSNVDCIKHLIRVVACSLFLLFVTSSCSPQREVRTIVLATTPWVGYYPLYYADELGLDTQIGINLKIIENLSIQDFRRTVVKNHIDAFACSMAEITQINQMLEMPLELALFTNFSNGSDVIVANENVASLEDIRGKTIGYQKYAISHFVALIALKSIGLEENEIRHMEVRPAEAQEMLATGEIDAYVTYPPVSIQLMASEGNHVIFDSKDAPYEIIDHIVIKGDRDTQMTRDLRRLWVLVLSRIRENPEEFLYFLAEQLGSSKKEATKSLQGVELLSWQEQAHFFQNPDEIKKLLHLACELTESTSLRCLRDLQFIRFGKVET